MRRTALSLLLMLTLTSYANAVTLSVSVSNLDEFNSTLLRGLLAHAKETGGVDVVTADANGDSELQKKQVKDLAARKVDALIALLADGDLGGQLTPIAIGAGVPLVYVNLWCAGLLANESRPMGKRPQNHRRGRPYQSGLLH